MKSISEIEKELKVIEKELKEITELKKIAELKESIKIRELVELMNHMEAYYKVFIINPTEEQLEQTAVKLYRKISAMRNGGTKRNNLKCPYCGKELHLCIGWTGRDQDTVDGKGSGYVCELSLDCKNDKCAYTFQLGGLKDISDFSEVVEDLRPYAGRLND